MGGALSIDGQKYTGISEFHRTLITHTHTHIHTHTHNPTQSEYTRICEHGALLTGSRAVATAATPLQGSHEPIVLVSSASAS